ncbi:MAG TPA: hypothetical protein VFI02_14050 [Armatimonadota bacterium]|nr:hypothetical protein [Armatimonadota bacterium]
MSDKTKAQLKDELADKDQQLEDLQVQLDNFKAQADSPEALENAERDAEFEAMRQRAETAEEMLSGSGAVIVTTTDLHADVPEGAYCFRSKWQMNPNPVVGGKHIPIHFGPTQTVLVDDTFCERRGVDKLALVKALKKFPSYGIEFMLTAGPDVEITETTKSYDRIALHKAEANKVKLIHGPRSSSAPEGGSE